MKSPSPRKYRSLSDGVGRMVEHTINRLNSGTAADTKSHAGHAGAEDRQPPQRPALRPVTDPDRTHKRPLR